MKKGYWKYVVSLLILAIYLMPIYVVVVTSLKPITNLEPRLTLPKEIYWENYVRLFRDTGILKAILNSMMITAGTLILVVVVGGMAAYPIARMKNRAGNIARVIVMGVMMVRGMAMVVGLYSVLSSMHALSTYWGMILVDAAFGLPVAIYMYSNFISSIPDVLDEAAAIDGAGVFGTFWKIIVPQLKPVTVSIVVMQGVSIWNEYGFATYILQKPDMYNVTLVVKQYFGEAVKDLNGAAASAVIAIIPVVIVYLLLQKYFVMGAVDSAVKG
ncbi:MAG: carbohydrate ABC transporter permease [Lachnospiraceae bacterium]|nr:carbohydrate ABC transporter permease [Lachnospiraceae bacterium]